MSIRFSCPDGHPLVVPDQRAGKSGRCPVCRQKVQIPRATNGDTPLAEASREVLVVEEDDLPEPPAPGALAEQDLPEPVAPQEVGVDSAVRPMIEDRRLAAASAPAAIGEPIVLASAEATGSVAARYSSPPRFIARAYFLAGVAAVITVLMIVPALGSLGTGAVWAWLLLSLGVVQALYLLWMVRLPDWSTVWVGALAFLPAAVGHLLAWIVSLTMARERLPLGLSVLTGPLAPWSAGLALLIAAVAISCWRVARPWRLDYEAFRRNS